MPIELAIAGLTAGAQAAISGLGNLWASRERRIQTENAINASTLDWMRHREDAKLAWERQHDYSYIMQQYKKAGINPYMVAGQSYTAPVSKGSSTQVANQAQGNFDMGNVISQIPIIAQQLQLMKTQQNNIDADTQNKKTLNEATQFDLSIEKKYKEVDRILGQQQASQLIENTKETRRNINRSTELLEAQSENERLKNTGILYNNELMRIQTKYNETLYKLDIATQTQSLRESRAQIQYLNKQMAQLQATTAQIYQTIEINKLQPEKMLAEINNIISNSGLNLEKTITEREMRPYNKAESASRTAKNTLGEGMKIWNNYQQQRNKFKGKSRR